MATEMEQIYEEKMTWLCHGWVSNLWPSWLLTMTQYLNWIRAMEFTTTMEVINIMFDELIRLMETSSIAMVIVLRLTGTTSLDVIPALSMILKCTIQQATRWMTTVSSMELLHLLLRHLLIKAIGPTSLSCNLTTCNSLMNGPLPQTIRPTLVYK